MNEQKISLRPMTEEDWPAVRAGFMHSFRDHRTDAVWDWRYQRTTPGSWHAVVGATPNGEIATFVAGSCHRAWIRGRGPAMVAISRDNYTAPQWRGISSGRSGLFARATRLYFDSLPDDVSFGVGVGNVRSVRLTGRLGIDQPCKAAAWHHCTPSQELLRGSSCLIHPCKFSADTAAWNRLWETRKHVQRAGLVRDGDFLAWRFDARQGNEYWCFSIRSAFVPDPLGYLVLTPYGTNAAMLVDAVLPQRPEQVRDAWAQVCARLGERGIARIWTLMSSANPEATLLPFMGFRPSDPPLAVLPAYWTDPACPDTATFERDYCFTLADSDLF